MYTMTCSCKGTCEGCSCAKTNIRCTTLCHNGATNAANCTRHPMAVSLNNIAATSVRTVVVLVCCLLISPFMAKLSSLYGDQALLPTSQNQFANAAHSESLPSPVDVNQLLVNQIHAFREQPNIFPFINSKSYLSTLASYALEPTPLAATVIMGPKDAGKSWGLSRMKIEWERNGHLVLQVNLKGRESQAFSTLMREIKVQIVRAMKLDDLDSLICLRQFMKSNCTDSEHFVQDQSFMQQITLDLKSVIANILLQTKSWKQPLMISAVIASIIAWLLDKTKDLLMWIKINKKTVCFAFTIILWGMFNFPGSDDLTLTIDRRMYSVTEGLQHGDWNSVVCACNALSSCSPQSRPILIVREMENLDRSSLHELLMSLERFKEGTILFPALLEASDRRWAAEFPVIKSSHSFRSYHLQEMSQAEGHAELVLKHKIWTEQEFESVYTAIGGHLGSHSSLFGLHAIGHVPLQNAIADMDLEADGLLHASLRKCGEHAPAAVTWLREFAGSNKFRFFDGCFTIPEHVNCLLHGNILFKVGCEIIPQHRMIQRAIGRNVHRIHGHIIKQN